jgi:hypothetical protein
MFAGGAAQAEDANSYIQAYLGDGSKPYASKPWSASQGAQGPVRSDMGAADGSNPNDLIQAHLGGDGAATHAQMNSGKNDSWPVSHGAQGPIRNDSMLDQRLFPLNASGS